jgi:hypothetical protein
MARRPTAGTWAVHADAVMDVAQRTLSRSTFTSFSDFTGVDADNTPLPADFIALAGYTLTNANVLNWRLNACPVNCAVQVERSLDGLNFTPIAALQAGQMGYYDADADIVDKHRVWYRLRAADDFSTEPSRILSGNSLFSNLVELNRTVASRLSLYPNPTTDFCIVQLQCSEPLQVDLSLLAMDGKEVLRLPLTTTAGENLIPLPQVAQLPAGVYALRYTAQNVDSGIIVTTGSFKLVKTQ